MRPLYISLTICAGIAVASYITRLEGWYSTYWYTDVILHLFAGVMFGTFWLWILMRDKEKSYSVWFMCLTILAFATLGSVLWEFWEFVGYRITPSHARFYIPDVGDTLNDIFCGMVGSQIVSLWVVYTNVLKR